MTASTDLPICTVPRQKDQGRQFLTDHLLREIDFDGQAGFVATVRMPSYRSLPLSCIVELHITVDGVEVDPDRLRLRVNGVVYRIPELADLPHVKWFVLDTADVLVGHTLDNADSHRVDAAFVTVEPYVTNGRFHRTKSASATIRVDRDWNKR